MNRIFGRIVGHYSLTTRDFHSRDVKRREDFRVSSYTRLVVNRVRNGDTYRGRLRPRSNVVVSGSMGVIRVTQSQRNNGVKDPDNTPGLHYCDMGFPDWVSSILEPFTDEMDGTRT